MHARLVSTEEERKPPLRFQVMFDEETNQPDYSSGRLLLSKDMLHVFSCHSMSSRGQ